jgi:glycosyltransferase involved in cell wall biosynthesis
LLVVAGSGEKAYEERVLSLVRQLSLAKDVLFTGMIHDELKWSAFATAEMFLLPSDQENFAISVAEAMHMAVPVIVSNKVNSWPYVAEAIAGLVINGNDLERELRLSIERLLTDRQHASDMGIRGQAFARQYLTWPHTAAQMARCYSQILNESPLQN